MNINYSVPQNVLVNDDGDPLQMIPELAYGDLLSVTFSAHDIDNEKVDLSTAAVWEFSVDVDRLISTGPLVETTNVSYSSTEKTLTFAISARTLNFLNAVNGKKQVALIAEMSGFDLSGNRVFRFPWSMLGIMPVDASGIAPEMPPYIAGIVQALSNCIYDTQTINRIIAGEKITGSFRVLEGCTSIGDAEADFPEEGCSIFYGCNGLTSVHLPASLQAIGCGAFYGCSGLTDISIPTGVTTIASYAFCGCSGLRNINFPGGLETIGSDAFSNCTNLRALTIPRSVNSIGTYAFFHCLSLETIVVDSENTTYDSRNGCNALIETATNKMKRACMNTTIPSTITEIDGAFADLHMTGILDLSGTSISNLSGYAFYNNDYTKIILPTVPNLTMNGEIFHGNQLCTEVVMHSNITSIPSSCFRCLFSLPSLTFPASVRQIGFWCCYSDTALTTVYILATTMTRIDSSAFSNCPNLTNIYCGFSQGAVSGAPWGANNATIHYNYSPEE